MSTTQSPEPDTAASNTPAGPAASLKRKRRLWARILLWLLAAIGAVILLLVLGGFVWLEIIAHRPSPVHAALTRQEISAEMARLGQLGVKVPGGTLLKERPFESPWDSHSLLVPWAWMQAKPPGAALLGVKLRADALLADLDVLEPVMQRAYGGWDTAAARGWNWKQWFADWRKTLAARGNEEISFDEAFAPMDRLLAFQRDNHTQIPLDRFYTSSGSQTAVLASAPRASCTEVRAAGRVTALAANDASQRVRAAKSWTSGEKSLAVAYYISMPGSNGIPEAIRCGSEWIALRPAGKGGGFWDMALRRVSWLLTTERARVERLGDGIVYARLPLMLPKNYDGLDQKSWPKRERSDRVLIVDARDNGGGSVEFGLRVLKGWVDEDPTTDFGQFGSAITTSCLYPALRWGFAGVFYGHSTSPDAREFEQSLVDEMAKPYPAGCPRTVNMQQPKRTYLQRRFAPKPGALRIIMLVNSRCGSDCEALTAMLAMRPDTLIAGTNTYGVAQFIQPGYGVLPHTGLAYRIALGNSNLYGDNRSLDGYGLDVDVVLPGVDTLGPGQLREFAEIVARL